MAKKKPGPPQVFVDEEGYETDGMFRWGGPKTSVSPDILHKWLEDFNSDLSMTAPERVLKLRSMLTTAIAPFVEGPLPPGANTGGRTAMFLNLSTGAGCYAINSAMPVRGWLRDAMDALTELAALEDLIAKSSDKLDQIVRLAFRIGVFVNRAELRANFGPSVITAKKRRKASAAGGHATAK
jgi:hypothetical protein